MYAYFIDDWVYSKQQRKLDHLDLLLTQAGISGRKIGLARLHDLGASIRDCIASGIKSLIAVGDDTTASRVLNQALLQQKEEGFSFSFGIVPMRDTSIIGLLLGISSFKKAADALSANQSKPVDLGLLNKRHYFATAAVFPKKCALGFRSYTVSSMYNDHHISVCNSDIYNQDLNESAKKFNPHDQVLEAVIAHRPNISFFDRLRGRGSNDQYIPECIFPVKKIIIKSKQKNLTVMADTEKQLSSPIEVEVVPNAVDMIFASKSVN
jgi:hypothetical protein